MPVAGKHIITQEEILSLYNEKKRYICIAESYVRDKVVAEEMVSQCLYRLLISMDSQYVSNAKSFFVTVIRNRCLNYLKRQRQECGLDRIGRRSVWMDTDIERLSSSGNGEEAKIDLLDLLEKCRRQMPDITYEVFMARRIDKRSYKEIARMFGMPETTVHFEIYKASRIFRREFKDYRVFCLALFLATFIPS